MTEQPPMHSEDDLLPLSALQHLLFCPRRAALVHIEGVWDESRATAEGSILHERVHSSGSESRGDVRIARSLRLHSLRLGLVGQADVVEFHRLPDAGPAQEASGSLPAGVALTGVKGLWKPFPIEYKVGRLRHERAYEVQLCAQALCLEEMLNVQVPQGALYYGKTARRLQIAFDERLRKDTEEAARRLHDLIGSGKTPTARYEKKCGECSLLNVCMPKVTGVRHNVGSYVQKELRSTEEDGP